MDVLPKLKFRENFTRNTLTDSQASKRIQSAFRGSSRAEERLLTKDIERKWLTSF